jgi:hypothetical protein
MIWAQSGYELSDCEDGMASKIFSDRCVNLMVFDPYLAFTTIASLYGPVGTGVFCYG